MSVLQRRVLSIGLVGAVLSGCSTLVGRHIDGKPTPCTSNWIGHTSCESTNGVPYALSRPSFKIERKTMTAGKKGNPVYDVVVDYKADPNRRFEVGMSRGWLTNDTFELTLDASGRASALNSSRADQTGRTVAALISVGAASAAVAAQLGAFASVDEEAAVLVELCSLIKRRGPTVGEKVCSADEGALGDKFTAARNRCKLINQSDCEKLMAPIGKEIAALAKRARTVLRLMECPAEIYRELATFPAANSQLVADWQTIVDAEALAGPSAESDDDGASQRLSSALKRLRDAANVAVADAAADPTDAAKKVAMEEAIDHLKQVVQVIVTADERLRGRALGDRRTKLLEFLRRSIPNAGKRNGETYGQYVAALKELDDTLETIAPKVSPPADPLADASEVTSRIDTGVLTERYASTPSVLQWRDRIKVAKIQIALECARAIVLVVPERTGTDGAMGAEPVAVTKVLPSTGPSESPGGAQDGSPATTLPAHPSVPPLPTPLPFGDNP